MKLISLFFLLLVSHMAIGQDYGEMINKLQHAVSVSITKHDTTELKNYFSDQQSFNRTVKFLFSIAAEKKKLKMTAEQVGVYRRSTDGIDTLTVVYMGGDDETYAPAILGQMIFTTKQDTKDWIFTSIKSIIPANKVKDPLRYLQVYINMQGMPPPPMKKIE